MLDDLTRRIIEFRDARDWKQFHTAKNVATSISIEAAELLELFQWSSDATIDADLARRKSDVERELADILIYCLLLAHDADIDLPAAIERKLSENERKYPADRARGSRAKYDEL